jgi:Cyclic nucleotide-binding domain
VFIPSLGSLKKMAPFIVVDELPRTELPGLATMVGKGSAETDVVKTVPSAFFLTVVPEGSFGPAGSYSTGRCLLPPKTPLSPTSAAKYRKNQTVFRQGELADSVFVIKEGKVKVCVVSEQGKEAVLAIHDKGAGVQQGAV